MGETNRVRSDIHASYSAEEDGKLPRDGRILAQPCHGVIRRGGQVPPDGRSTVGLSRGAFRRGGHVPLGVLGPVARSRSLLLRSGRAPFYHVAHVARPLSVESTSVQRDCGRLVLRGPQSTFAVSQRESDLHRSSHREFRHGGLRRGHAPDSDRLGPGLVTTRPGPYTISTSVDFRSGLACGNRPAARPRADPPGSTPPR